MKLFSFIIAAGIALIQFTCLIAACYWEKTDRQLSRQFLRLGYVAAAANILYLGVIICAGV